MNIQYKIEMLISSEGRVLTFNYLMDDSFKFVECGGEDWKNYLCIIQGSSPRYRKMLDDMYVSQYKLPFGIIIVSFCGIRFKGKTQPPLISIEDLNERLENIKREIIWIKSRMIYRLISIDGIDNITVCELDPSTKEIIIRNDYHLEDLVSIIPPLKGETAERIWNENTI